MNKKIWIGVGIVLLIVVVVGAILMNNSSDEVSISDDTQQQTTETPIETEELEINLVYTAGGDLIDVTVDGLSSGIVKAEYYGNNTYDLLARFDNLPEIDNSQFYEGWLVNQSTSDFFSTGAVERSMNGQVINSYSSATDHQAEGYDFYVLTLEPDDGDPAPAEHILEGTLNLVN